MSIVLSYVNTEKAIVASDGLVSNENKDAVFCNEIKVFRINGEKVFTCQSESQQVQVPILIGLTFRIRENSLLVSHYLHQ